MLMMIIPFQLYDEADMQEEKVRISRMLGMVQDEKLIQRVLEFAMSVSISNQSYALYG